MEKKIKTLSLVVPVYNEAEVLSASFERMRDAMEATGCPFELIYVDDGSRDDTLPMLRALADKDRRVRVLSFSRNFGHQTAVTAGMDIAEGDAVIIIDVDLQDPPEVIPEMVRAWENGADIAYGKRAAREGETLFKKLTAHCYYRLLSTMSAYPIPLDTGDFRLIDRAVADEFLNMREHNRFLRGMSAWMGYKAEPIEYVRKERFAGSSKYTLKKMLKLAADGIFGFSNTPLMLPGVAGGAIMALSLAGFVALAICAATSGAETWLWAVCGLALIGGMVLAALGVAGAYISRMYDELKGRPLYIVKERINTTEND